MSEHVMDEETRKKLLTRLPFSRKATIPFTPEIYLVKVLDEKGKETDEYEIPEEFRPVFEVRPFSQEDKEKLKKVEKNPDEKVLKEIVRSNITGLSKLYDAGTMVEIPFDPDENKNMSLEQFSSLPIIVQRQLFVFISGISGLSAYERSGL